MYNSIVTSRVGGKPPKCGAWPPVSAGPAASTQKYRWKFLYRSIFKRSNIGRSPVQTDLWLHNKL